MSLICSADFTISFPGIGTHTNTISSPSWECSAHLNMICAKCQKKQEEHEPVTTMYQRQMNIISECFLLHTCSVCFHHMEWCHSSLNQILSYHYVVQYFNWQIYETVGNWLGEIKGQPLTILVGSHWYSLDSRRYWHYTLTSLDYAY